MNHAKFNPTGNVQLKELVLRLYVDAGFSLLKL